MQPELEPIPEWITFVVVDQFLTLFPGTSRDVMIKIPSIDSMAVLVKLIDFWNHAGAIRQSDPLKK